MENIQYLDHHDPDTLGVMLDIESAKEEPSIDLVQVLINSGANLEIANDRTNFRTPLVRAAAHGHIQIVRMLLDAGANIHGSEGSYYSPLQEAANGGYSEIVKMLIKAGADVNESRDISLDTSLHLALRHGDLETIKALLDAGANIRSKDYYGANAAASAAHYGHQDALAYMMTLPEFEEISWSHGITLMHYAALGNEADMIRFLVNRGFPIDVPNEFGNTPLLMAAYCHPIESEGVQLLLSLGADINAINNDGDSAYNIFLKRALK